VDNLIDDSIVREMKGKASSIKCTGKAVSGLFLWIQPFNQTGIRSD